MRPIEQEIVVIEHVLRLLGLDIAREQPAQLVLPSRAPWKVRAEHIVQRRLAVDGARIDREAGPLVGKAALGLGKSELVPNQIHQVGGILTIVDGEIAVKSDLCGIFAQQPGADRMECAGPGEPSVGAGAFDPINCAQMRSTRRVISAAARREKVISMMRRGSAPLHDQMRDAVRQRIGLAGARPGNDQKRAARGRRRATVLDGVALLRIELFQARRRHR